MPLYWVRREGAPVSTGFAYESERLLAVGDVFEAGRRPLRVVEFQIYPPATGPYEAIVLVSDSAG